MNLLRNITKNSVVSSLLLFFLIGVSFGEIKTRNTARYMSRNMWEWSVFIEAPQNELDQIERVEYLLHPTFRNNRVVIDTRDNNFKLTRRGWGTFTIKVTLFHTNGQTTELEHPLVFESTQASSEFDQLGADNWSREKESDWWEWGVHLTGPAQLLNKVRCVEYTLHPSFPNPKRTVCERENRFELKTSGWGTFTIAIRVMLQDGSVVNLEHELTFD